MYKNSFNYWLKRLSNETESRIFEVKTSLPYWLILDQYHKTICSARSKKQAERISNSIIGASIQEVRA